MNFQLGKRKQDPVGSDDEATVNKEFKAAPAEHPNDDRICCAAVSGKAPASAKSRFEEVTQLVLSKNLGHVSRPLGQRPPEHALVHGSQLVFKSLMHLLRQKNSDPTTPPATGKIWYWDNDQYKRWISSNAFNLAFDPVHLSQCWLYCNPPKSRGDGYVQTAIGLSHRSGAKSDRPMLHNVSFALANPSKVHLLASRWFLDPTTGQESKQGEERQRLEVSHLCHRNACFNPWHLVLEPHTVNEDRKGCKYGCPHRCPHNPMCIFDV